MRGEVNPAELFTKHFLSQVRVTELLRLFGCRSAGGRADGAPQLRREAGVSHAGILAIEAARSADTICQEGWAYAAVELVESGGQKLPEASVHNKQVFRHQILGDLEAMFPRAIAGKEPEEPAAINEVEDMFEPSGSRGDR